ncbi:MAG: hypothetical protein IPO81_29360 [Kouleothrix sp.]|nr:hypothetical protein [Kouleothrix sp.]
MTTRTVTLDLPELLYQKLQARAAQTRRTVEDELLEVLATAVPVADDLPMIDGCHHAASDAGRYRPLASGTDPAAL